MSSFYICHKDEDGLWFAEADGDGMFNGWNSSHNFAEEFPSRQAAQDFLDSNEGALNAEMSDPRDRNYIRSKAFIKEF